MENNRQNVRMYALFGPGGNSEDFYAEGHKHTHEAPRWLFDRGLDAYEYQAGNGVYGSKETFEKIGAEARKYGISMSLHAPYFISLSGVEEETRLKSVGYIKKSLEAASWMSADLIVIHTGSAAKITRLQAMALAKDTLLRTLDEIGDTEIKLGLETMGKVNQLGTLDEVIELCKLDRRFVPVVDFGHLNARNFGDAFAGRAEYERVFDLVGSALGDEVAKNLHCHFSRIEWTKAGEKRHLTFEDREFGPDFEPLMEVLVKNGLTPRIICESAGTMAADALAMRRYYRSLI